MPIIGLALEEGYQMAYRFLALLIEGMRALGVTSEFTFGTLNLIA
jgi:hypothetical protein